MLRKIIKKNSWKYMVNFATTPENNEPNKCLKCTIKTHLNKSWWILHYLCMCTGLVFFFFSIFKTIFLVTMMLQYFCSCLPGRWCMGENWNSREEQLQLRVKEGSIVFTRMYLFDLDTCNLIVCDLCYTSVT